MAPRRRKAIRVKRTKPKPKWGAVSHNVKKPVHRKKVKKGGFNVENRDVPHHDDMSRSTDIHVPLLKDIPIKGRIPSPSSGKQDSWDISEVVFSDINGGFNVENRDVPHHDDMSRSTDIHVPLLKDIPIKGRIPSPSSGKQDSWDLSEVVFSDINGGFNVENKDVPHHDDMSRSTDIHVPLLKDIPIKGRIPSPSSGKQDSWDLSEVVFSDINGGFNVENKDVPHHDDMSRSTDIHVPLLKDIPIKGRIPSPSSGKQDSWDLSEVVFSDINGGFNVENKDVPHHDDMSRSTDIHVPLLKDIPIKGRIPSPSSGKQDSWDLSEVVFSDINGGFNVENKDVPHHDDMSRSTDIHVPLLKDIPIKGRIPSPSSGKQDSWDLSEVVFSDINGGFNVENKDVPHHDDMSRSTDIHVPLLKDIPIKGRIPSPSSGKQDSWDLSEVVFSDINGGFNVENKDVPHHDDMSRSTDIHVPLLKDIPIKGRIPSPSSGKQDSWDLSEVVFSDINGGFNVENKDVPHHDDMSRSTDIHVPLLKDIPIKGRIPSPSSGKQDSWDLSEVVFSDINGGFNVENKDVPHHDDMSRSTDIHVPLLKDIPIKGPIPSPSSGNQDSWDISDVVFSDINGSMNLEAICRLPQLDYLHSIDDCIPPSEDNFDPQYLHMDNMERNQSQIQLQPRSHEDHAIVDRKKTRSSDWDPESGSDYNPSEEDPSECSSHSENSMYESCTPERPKPKSSFVQTKNRNGSELFDQSHPSCDVGNDHSFIPLNTKMATSTSHTTERNQSQTKLKAPIHSLVGNNKSNRPEATRTYVEDYDKTAIQFCAQSCLDYGVDEDFPRIQIHGVSGKIGPRDNRHCCLFCQKHFKNLNRHFITVHCSEKAIKHLLPLSPSDPDRQHLLEKLRLEGDFNHNVAVLNAKRGIFLVVRRSQQEVEAKYYLPCLYCLGFFRNNELYKHLRICKHYEGTGMKYASTKDCRLLLTSRSSGTTNSEYHREIIMKLRNDELSAVLKEDELILDFGKFLFEKHGKVHFPYISARLRQLARLLREFQTDTCSMQLIDLLDPTHFDTIVDKVKEIGFSERTPDKSKSYGLKIGHSLRKLSLLMLSRALKDKNYELKKRLKEFIQVMNAEWTERVSSHCLKSLYDAKLDSYDLLPLTSDLKKIGSYLKRQIVECYDILSNSSSPNVKQWQDLASVTLCKLVVFNKRRGGEAGKILVANYRKKVKGMDINDEIYQSLTSFEKGLATKLELLKIKGKKGRHVPVILTPDVSKSMDLLQNTRDLVGIFPENPYFFANTGEKYLRSWDVLREICKTCGVSKSVTSTNMRKYVATVSQILNMNEEELDIVARHLGHDITVHRQFYRLHDNILELSKVSKLLLAVDEGTAHTYAGKCLKDLYQNEKDQEKINCELGIASTSNTNICKDVDPSKELEMDQQIDDPATELEMIEDTSGSKRKRKRTSHQVWDSNIRRAALAHFAVNLKLKKAPGKKECEQFLEKYDCDRKWQDLKNLIKNSYYGG